MRGAAQFQGSKRKGRINSAEDREVRRVRARLRKIRLLAQRLTSEYEVEAYCQKIGDETLRSAVKKMIYSFRPDLRRYQ